MFGTWKREQVQDHKFDFVNVREFTDNGFSMRMKYMWLYIIVLKSFLVYVSDIFTATTMVSSGTWSNQIYQQCQNLNGCFYVPFNVGQGLFIGCISFSFLLLGYEARKARKIIKSRDISYAFTNVMANHYYSLRSYDHFCFFDHISNSTKTADEFAFFIFFTFKSWKRLLLADAPRQTINALILYTFYLIKQNDGKWYDIGKYFRNNDGISTSLLMVTTSLTFLIFAGSLLLLIVAGVCYIPLLIYIQGNLKEFVCHKVDKRISEVIKRMNKTRLAKAAVLAKKEAAGDYSHLKNKKGELIAKPLPQPTLPNLSVDDDDDMDDQASFRTREPPPSVFSQSQDWHNYNPDYKGPMPAYNEYDYPAMPHLNQGYDNYSAYAPSQEYLGANDAYYTEENNSTAHLTSGMQPYTPTERPVSAALPNPYGGAPEEQHGHYAAQDATTHNYGYDAHGYSGQAPPQQYAPNQGYDAYGSRGNQPSYGHAV